MFFDPVSDFDIPQIKVVPKYIFVKRHVNLGLIYRVVCLNLFEINYKQQIFNFTRTLG